MMWKPYLNDRLIAEHPEGFYVIKPVDYVMTADPLFCPVCDGIMRGAFDDEAYKRFSCCDKCANSWAYPNVEKWKQGWRPSSDEIRNNCSKSPI